ADAKPAEALPAKVSGFADSGAFNLYKDEERLAHIDFTWKDDGTFDNKSVLEFGGQKLDMQIRITPDKDGRWAKIEGTSRAGKVTMEREADKVKRTLGEKTKTFALKPGAVLFESFAPALMSQIVRAYDKDRGGKQTLPVVVIPETLLDATLERQDQVERSAAGK